MGSATNGRTVVVSGVGRMGVRHVVAARQAGMAVLGIHDIEDSTAQHAAIELGIDSANVYDDLSSMLAETHPDALVVASTANGHFEACASALDAGVATILCEKPFTASVREAEDLVARASAIGARIAVNHQTRFTARYQLISELLACGLIGDFVSLTASTGSIGLAMGTSHYIELFRLLAADSISEVRFLADSDRDVNPRGSAFHDPAGRLLLDTIHDRRMYIDFGAEAGHGMTTVIAAETGRLVMDDVSGKISVDFRWPADRTAPRTRYAMDGVEGGFSVPIEDAVVSTTRVWQAIWSAGDYPTDTDGLDIVRILAAAELSAERSGAPVHPTDPDAHVRAHAWA